MKKSGREGEGKERGREGRKEESYRDLIRKTSEEILRFCFAHMDFKNLILRCPDVSMLPLIGCWLQSKAIARQSHKILYFKSMKICL